MKRISLYLCIVLFLWVLLSGCEAQGGRLTSDDATSTPTLNLEPTLNFPVVRTTRIPDASKTARAFLDAWRSADFPGMYAFLDKNSREIIGKEEFLEQLRELGWQGVFTDMEYEMGSSWNSSGEAEVQYRTVLHTDLMGEIQDENQMTLRLEEGEWRVIWEPGLILSGLRGGNSLKLEWDEPVSGRGAIYASDGQPLAAPGQAAAVGLWLNNLQEGDLERLYRSLAVLFNRRSESIQAQVEAALELGDDYLAVGEVTLEELRQRAPGLDGFSGVQVSVYSGRFYHGSLAPHLTGYVGSIHSEELERYTLQGYSQDALVGQYGLESWGEKILGGQRGGALYIVNGQGERVKKLAEVESSAPQEIHTTIDIDLQRAAQAALEGFRGAAVVMERDTGRVLALVSSPGFDPNAFAPANFNSYDLLNGILTDPAQPLYNRATEGQYPLGSVFKIITMAAALEAGGYTPDTNYQCNYTFDELPGMTLYDWTWEHFQEDGETRPSGLLTLTGGLIRSCNPFFWHIGLDLYRRGLDRAIADMAIGFGLGDSTGLVELADKPGNIPVPGSEVDAVNLAIGQGNMQVTPIQVANFAAAVGNGGTLYKPQVIEMIMSPGGDDTYRFEPQKRGELPLKPETLQAIQEAMSGVVTSREPRGTAFHIFNGLRIPVAGKTGTATAGAVLPHAWFAGYTFAEDPEKPDLAIAVIVENIGEGSDYAAPIFRRLVETYFLGSPGKQLPWEKRGGEGGPAEAPPEGSPPLIDRDP